jgi:hypothetical protein
MPDWAKLTINEETTQNKAHIATGPGRLAPATSKITVNRYSVSPAAKPAAASGARVV